MYARLASALGLRFEATMLDPRRPAAGRGGDTVHAAMGELEAARLGARGFRVAIDEPYQHYQFAGRADVVAWDTDARALLHLENRTRFPNLQERPGRSTPSVPTWAPPSPRASGSRRGAARPI